MKKVFTLITAVVLALLGTVSISAKTTWTFKDNVALWGTATLNGGNQYDESAQAVTSGGLTFTGTNGFVSTALGIGFNTTGSATDENISLVVPKGYKATVTIYTSSNRTVVAVFGDAENQTFNASWAASTKEFDNTAGDGDVTLYLYCNQNPGGNNQKQAPFLQSIVLEDFSSAIDYTINYGKDAENIVKTVTSSAVAGTQVNTEASFYSENAENKYIREASEAESVTVTAEENVFFVKVRDAEVYKYSVVSSLGATITSGSTFEGDDVSYFYPRYQLSEGKLYEAAKAGSAYYKGTLNVNTDNASVTVNYTEKNVDNVVFLSEMEDIEGATSSSSSNADIRCSGGKGAYFAEDNVITNLPAGKYKIFSSVWGSAGTDFNINAGDNNVFTISTTGSIADNTSAEFTLTEATDLVIAAQGNANRVIDLIYIQKTGEYNYFEIEANLPDTVTVTLGEVEDYAKLNLSDYISVKTNAEEYFPVINYAVAEEGVDKKDATYTPVLSEKPLYEVFTEPGTYYVFANVVAVFADESVDNISTDTIVVVLKEKETEPAEEPGVKYSYTLTSDITQLGTYDVTGGSIELLSGALETKNNLYGQKSGSTITAQVNMGRKLKANDCIRLTMFCSSNNKSTGLDITKDGTTSLVYFPLPSGNNKAYTYTVEYIVKESDVDLIGVDTFSIKKITATDNLYLTGVEVEVLEKKAPVFTVQPVGKNVAAYEYVNIPVKATGFPEPTYQWYVDGEPVDYNSEIGIYIGEAKTYTVYVTATNSEGSVNSEVIELKAIDDVFLNGNKCVISTDMEVADGLNFFAEDCIVHLLDNGNFSVQAADAAEAPAGYSAIINGTVNPTVNGNDVTGVGYNVFPYKTGVFTFVGKFNAGKAVNIMKVKYDVAAKAAAGSLQADEETVSFKVGETEYTSGDSFSETYNGPISFDVEDEYEYIIYASGSKIGMYGFDFTEATAVDGVSEAQESVKKEGKFIENGQIVILKAGKKFNAAGAQIK